MSRMDTDKEDDLEGLALIQRCLCRIPTLHGLAAHRWFVTDRFFGYSRYMRTALIIAMTLLVLFGAVFALHQHVDRTYAQPSRDLSKMMTVRSAISEALSAHYKQQGQFPLSLADLPLERLPLGDEGSSVRDVASWHYTANGRSFVMTWTNALGSELYLGGKTGQIFFARDDARGKNP